MEIPGYEPRALQTMALGFAVGSRGADHNKSGAYELDFSDRVDRLRGSDRAAALAIEPEDKAALMDSLILCKFLRGTLSDFYGESAELLSAVTGFDISSTTLQASAARIVALKKLYNVGQGWTAAEDTLPARFFDEALPGGVAKGTRLPREGFRAMVRAYYAGRGWDAEGRMSEGEERELLALATPPP